ncbi:MAG: hypothetical protein LBG78_02240 [Azoarcus sp.]|jgi:hypothetical protein|nr:hypothetical protein [Azoarcus sp.]
MIAENSGIGVRMTYKSSWVVFWALGKRPTEIPVIASRKAKQSLLLFRPLWIASSLRFSQ